MSHCQIICDYEGGPCRMGIRVLWAALIFVILLSATTWSQSPYISGLAGPTSSPVSQSQQSLFLSPNRYDTGGNRLIEGNVRGGTYFRGNVPYQSTTSFRGSVPSADTLSSFLRYSAGQEDFSREPGKYSRTVPYYNPSQTVTFTTPSRSGVFTSENASEALSVSGRTEGELVQTAQPSTRVLAGASTSFSDLRSRPMTMSMEEMERLISAEVGPPGQEEVEGLTTEVAGPGAEQISDRTADLRIRPVGQEETRQRFELAGRPYAEESAAVEDRARAIMQLEREQMLAKRQVESEDFGKTSMSSDKSLSRTTDVPVRGRQVSTGIDGEQQDLFETYKQVKQQIDNLQEALKQLRAGKDAEAASATKSVSELRKTAGAEEESGQFDLRYPDIKTQLESFRKNIERLSSDKRQALRPLDRTALQLRPERKDEFTAADVSAQAKRILGGKSLPAFSEDKFNEYMKAAEIYQKQGRHYRAISAYTLASIYKPGEALAHAGRSHALFAAGEYMSSALYLSRALEISPEYAKVKVDLLAILGTDDKEKLDSRIAEIEQWYKRSDEANLQFLLGYIYYQAGELDKAKEAIDTAHSRMPDSPAVDTLREVIGKK